MIIWYHIDMGMFTHIHGECDLYMQNTLFGTYWESEYRLGAYTTKQGQHTQGIFVVSGFTFPLEL